MESSKALTTLDQLPIGSRLLVRAKKEWRMAAVAAIREDLVVLTICSASGRTYRLRRRTDSAVVHEGFIPLLHPEHSEDWRENFLAYDTRW